MPFRYIRLSAAVIVFLCSAFSRAQTTDVLVLSGEPAPDGNGTLASFIDDPSDPGTAVGTGPSLNDAGQVVFPAFLTGTTGGPGTPSDDSGIFLYSGGEVIQIVREGQVPPDGDGVFANFNNIVEPAIGPDGRVTFQHYLRNSASGAFLETGEFTAAPGAWELSILLRTGDLSPDGDSLVQSVATPAVSRNGRLGFVGVLESTDPLGDRALFTTPAGAGEVELIVRKYDDAPNSGSYRLISGGDLNDAGQVVFQSTLFGAFSDQGIFRSEPGGSITQIARRGDPEPNGGGVITTFFNDSRTPINEVGQVLFAPVFAPCLGCAASGGGIYRYEADGSTSLIARTGPFVPGIGVFTGFGVPGTLTVVPALNDSGQVAFFGFPARDGLIFNGIYRWTDGEIIEIVNNWMLTPDGGYYFTLDSNGSPAFESNDVPKMNEAGQIAFFTNLRNTAGNQTSVGIFFYDDTEGLLKVAQKGDAMLGSTIETLRFTPRGSSAHDNSHSGLNNLGQVAYVFELADGRSGVALWSPPGVATTSDSPATPADRVRIEEIYPNPFRDAVTLELTLPRPETNLTIDLHDEIGRRVLQRHLGGLSAGSHTVTLDGGMLPEALYFVRLTADGRTVATTQVARID